MAPCLEWRNLHMQYGRYAGIDRRKAAIDRGGEVAGFPDMLGVRAKGASDLREVAPVSLPSGSQPRLKGIALRSGAVRIDALRRGLDRLPAAIVEHHCEYRQLILLRHGEDGVRRREVKAAVADDLHDAARGLRQPETERHPAAEAEPAAGKPDVTAGFGPAN